MPQKISQLAAAAAIVATDLVELSKLSTTVTMTSTTLSALASDNSYNDSANQFVAEGFAVGNNVRVTNFTGNVANNIFSAKITALTASKMTIGGTDGDVIVDDAAGESVTITKWESYYGTAAQMAAYVASTGAGNVPAQRFTIELLDTTDSDPGAGLVKFNNATPTSATQIYIDDSTSDAVDLSTYFASLGQTGFLKIQSVADAGEWAIFRWTATVDGSGYWKFTVVIQAFLGTLDDADAVLIEFDSDVAGSGGTELKGLTFTSDTGSTADSDPGAGLMKWNNATQGSATKLFFDNTTLDTITISAFFATLSTDGTVFMQQADDSTRWQLWEIDTATADAGYYDMAVTLLAKSAADIADNVTVYCSFQKGATGAGSVSTDTIFDALGDLVVGSGSNASARLPIGATSHVLTVVGGTAAWAASTGGTGIDRGKALDIFNIATFL